MLMSAFDEAWEIAKMARHKVGPVEIWDYNEPFLDSDRVKDHEKFNEMGIPLMQDRGPDRNGTGSGGQEQDGKEMNLQKAKRKDHRKFGMNAIAIEQITSQWVEVPGLEKWHLRLE